MPQLYVYAGVALAVVLAFGGMYLKGRHDGIASLRVQLEAERLEAMERTLDYERRMSDLQQAHSVALSKALSKTRVVTKEIVREVPTLVSSAADSKCVVPAGFVLVHNNAAAGLPITTDASSGTADSPSGVALSTVAETVAENYGTCAEIRAKLISWQTWYADALKSLKDAR